jgi:iron complex outermembrane receptor protein
LTQSCTGTSTTGCTSTTPQYTFTAPSGLNIAQTPSDVETEGILYQHKAWDVGFFNKRVGTEYEDVGAYHNQTTIDPFTLSNLNFNYTIRSGGRFNGTKVQLAFNNLFNQHSVTSISNAGSAVTQIFAANGTSYINPFVTIGQTPISGQDAISILPARSINLTVTFGHTFKK